MFDKPGVELTHAYDAFFIIRSSNFKSLVV